jgi:glutathione synthase
MTLRVAVQMDPIASVNIASDSTFALMLAAQARGHALFHYAAGDLGWRDGRVFARAQQVEVRPVAGDHFTLGEPRSFDLADDVTSC